MPLPRTLPAILPMSLLEAFTVTTATITNNGLSLLAQALISSGANSVISYVAIGTGSGTLTTGLTSGTPTTSLATTALPAGLSIGQSLTLINDIHTAVVTVASPGASLGATSIPIQSFTSSFSFPIGSGVLTTPSVNDIGLQVETARVVVDAGVTGAQPGETLVSGYFDPSAATATYIEVGYFGGSTASGTLGSGTLVARDVMWWPHTIYVDSFTNQLDSTV